MSKLQEAQAAALKHMAHHMTAATSVPVTIENDGRLGYASYLRVSCVGDNLAAMGFVAAWAEANGANTSVVQTPTYDGSKTFFIMSVGNATGDDSTPEAMLAEMGRSIQEVIGGPAISFTPYHAPGFGKVITAGYQTAQLADQYLDALLGVLKESGLTILVDRCPLPAGGVGAVITFE